MFFYLNLIALGTIIFTSLLAYREASRLGFGAQKVSSNDFNVDFRGAPSQGPVATWVATPHHMYGIGATFSDGFWPWSYMAPRVLGKTYDGLIFINRTTRARPAATSTDWSGIENSN